ncbi:DUF5684 domain-containing protein [Solitalea canadensis]|uniref:Signal peptidase I n=1 Tax=Solitalea canadensis (strain ATCC 29591 / DSM 3403 / JCM 21819 / LMG 8368 / NBRC 15130 / NCIMB 12057 / USAM 9D) TaxID=929556 RepID=H8KPB2_SOLCM|nr:DUF5684 domain-containing protein [Solitalea canadensis]AFD05810.1 hypothetical protein Solca_0685 [Solitalea canadensis DSM 3403]
MENSAVGAAVGLFSLVYLAIVILVIASMWKVFSKAGKPGWASIIPIYNIIVLLEITGRPLWWIVLMLIPFVNIIVAIIVMIDLAKSFGKGTGFGIGLILLGFIFFPILGFGDATYQGPKSTDLQGLSNSNQ